MWLQAFCKAARLSVWTVNLISAQKKKQGGREGGGEPRIPDVSQTLRKASPRVYEDTFLVLTVCRCPSRSFTCHKHGVGGSTAARLQLGPPNSQPPHISFCSQGIQTTPGKQSKNSQGIPASITAPPHQGADEEWNGKHFPTQESVQLKQLRNRTASPPGCYYFRLGGLAHHAECDANVDAVLNEPIIFSRRGRRLV